MLSKPRIYIWPQWTLLSRKFAGVTRPPIGVFISRRFWDGASLARRRQLLRHELVHWEQYERYGLIQFLGRYSWLFIRHGYQNHPMEIEARRKNLTRG